MDRPEATARVDQILAWQREEMRTGQCPLCGVKAEPWGVAPDEWVQQVKAQGDDLGGASKMRGFGFIHEDDCELANVAHEIVDLCNRFDIRLERRLITLVIDGERHTGMYMARVEAST